MNMILSYDVTASIELFESSRRGSNPRRTTNYMNYSIIVEYI